MGRNARLLEPNQAVSRKFAWTKFWPTSQGDPNDIFLSQTA